MFLACFVHLKLKNLFLLSLRHKLYVASFTKVGEEVRLKGVICAKTDTGDKKFFAQITLFPDGDRLPFPVIGIAFRCCKHPTGRCMVVFAGCIRTSGKKMFTFLKCKHLFGERMFSFMECKHTCAKKKFLLSGRKYPFGQNMLPCCYSRYKQGRKQVVFTGCRHRLHRGMSTPDDQRMEKVSLMPGAGMGIPACIGAAGNNEGLIRSVRSSRIS